MLINISSKRSGIVYVLEWKESNLSLWIERKEDTWQMISEKITSKEQATKFASNYIDSHLL